MGLVGQIADLSGLEQVSALFYYFQPLCRLNHDCHIPLKIQTRSIKVYSDPKVDDKASFVALITSTLIVRPKAGCIPQKTVVSYSAR